MDTIFKKYHIFLLSACVILFASCFSFVSQAKGIASDTAFDSAVWEPVFEVPILHESGVVQSMCSTEDYIICIENSIDLANDPDVVSAYYKNTTDADGNPVEQYSLAMKTFDTPYEHANGMAYNPKKNEIYVAGYTNLDEENLGCLFIMDASTLEYKGKIQVLDYCNILGIDYDIENDRYIIQTNSDGNYTFMILDSSFQVIDNLGDFNAENVGTNYQDLGLSGDYYMNLPLTLGMGIGNYVNMYSISRKAQVSSSYMELNLEDGIATNEPEGICETSPGEFMTPVTIVKNDGSRLLRVYKTVIDAYNFGIDVSGENVTVSEGSADISRGSSYTVTYTPADDYQLSYLIVDGVKVSASDYPDSYTFDDVQTNHSIQIVTEPVAAPVPESNGNPLAAVGSLFSGIGSAVGNGFTAAGHALRSFVTSWIFLLFIIIGAVGLYGYVRLVRIRRIRAEKLRRAKRLRKLQYAEMEE